MAKLEPAVISELIERYRQGATTREIGSDLGLHHSTIAKYINKHAETRTLKTDPEFVPKIVKRYREGASLREIGQELKLHHSTVSKYIKKYAGPLGHGDTLGQPPPPGVQVNKVLDKIDLDGSTEVIKMDRPATVEEMRNWCGLDKRLYIPQYYKANTWQGFYKLKQLGITDEAIKWIYEEAKSGRSLKSILARGVPFVEAHRKVQLIQSKVVWKRVVTDQLEDAIVEFIRWKTPKGGERMGPKAKKKPRSILKLLEQMLVWGLWDAHIGMYAWQAECGADFDVDMVCNRIFNSIDDMIEELKHYNIGRIVMPIGNDFLHFDSVKMTTTMGDHFLDTDTRYARVYLAGLKCLAYMLERGLEISNNIDLLYVPGNHDTTSSFGLCVALAQRYRTDKRVKVRLDPNPRKYVTYGGCIIGFHHGKDTRAERFPLIFGQEAKEYWSKSTYREVQIGHTHQRQEKNYAGVIPTNNLLVRTNPTLCNADAWHHNKGLLGEPQKSVEAWRYDRIGYRGSHVAWARDDKNPNLGSLEDLSDV